MLLSDAGERSLGSQLIPKLSPGTSVTKAKALWIGKGLSPDVCCVGVTVDSTHMISEADETNNTGYAPLTVE